MKIICAWCKKVLKDGLDNQISHGICNDCKANQMAELKELRRRTSRPGAYPGRGAPAPR